MATKQGSGFNAEKFRKLVAMFDSPSSEEAEVAFRRALAELRKDQLRFCDRLVDSEETQRIKEECARVEAELREVFARAARRESEVKELQATIDRLNERIATMEEDAANSGGFDFSGNGAGPPADPDFEFVPQYPDEPEPYSGQAFSIDARLPVWMAAVWGCLASFVVFYGLAVLTARGVPTADNWNTWLNSTGAVIGVGLSAVVVAVAVAWSLSERKFIDDGGASRFSMYGILSSPRSMIVAALGLLFILAGCYGYSAIWGRGHIGTFGAAVLGIAGALVLAWFISDINAKQGPQAVVLKLALLVDGIVLITWIGFLPYDHGKGIHAVYIPASVMTPVLVVIAIFTIVIEKLPASAVHAILDRRKVFWGIVIPAALFLVAFVFAALDNGLTQYSITPGMIVYASDGTDGGASFNAGDLGALAFLALVVFIAIRIAVGMDRKKKLEKARRDAHTFNPPNVHGNAGEVSKKDARSKGWI